MEARADRDRLAGLASIPLFAELPSEALRDVLERATEFEVRPGHVLVEANMPGQGLFVIEEGRAAVDLPGRRIELGPGDFFGELALLDESAIHFGRVSAITALRCLAVRRNDFDSLLESQPTIARSMLRVLARRLADMIRQRAG